MEMLTLRNGQMIEAEVYFGWNIPHEAPEGGSARDDEFGALQSTPAALGGTTQSPYVVVPNADIVCARAKAAGAEIVRTIQDEDYGGRGFSCRDPAGQL